MSPSRWSSRRRGRRRRLGQHFMVDPIVLDTLLRAAELTGEDVVLEIGAGRGNLTQPLAERAGKVYAVELDDRLFQFLSERMKRISNVIPIHEDILKMDLDPLGRKLKVIGNIPYYISTPILDKLLENRSRVSLMVLTLQKEVACRLTSGPGTKEYGSLSLWMQYHASVEMVADVPREAFRPPPEVDSAIIRARIRERPPVKVTDEELFFELARTAFSHRRKTLLNNLKGATRPRLSVEEWRNLLASLGMDERIRGEMLSMEDYAHLCNAVAAGLSEG